MTAAGLLNSPDLPEPPGGEPLPPDGDRLPGGGGGAICGGKGRRDTTYITVPGLPRQAVQAPLRHEWKVPLPAIPSAT